MRLYLMQRYTFFNKSPTIYCKMRKKSVSLHHKLDKMRRYTFFILFFSVLLVSCSTTKSVPEGEYLLNKSKIKITDTKDVQADNLRSYLRQTQNTEVFGFWKLQLNVYNWAGQDTSKWVNRTLHKIGEAPEIFSNALTDASRFQLQKAMFNRGYFNATVDTSLLFKKQKKVNLTYHITAHEPYRIRKYRVDLPAVLREYATNQYCKIEPGMLFDADILEEERARITNRMRRNGYYYFEKEYLQYTADSTLSSHEVDVTISLQDYWREESEEVQKQLFTAFHISKVLFHTEYDKAVFNKEDIDTVSHGDYYFSYAGKPIMRERALIRACKIVPGELYNEQKVEQTYAALNSLGPVKYVNISFRQLGEDELVCVIVLSKDKTHSVTAEVEGTYSAGDWGVAAGVGYTNRNIFRGAEEFSISGRGAYEWRENGSRGIEAKAEASLTWPNSLKLSVSYNYQQRPDEFTRTIANAGIQYTLVGKNRRLKHFFTPINISYVYLPSISDAFRDQFLRDDNILKYSYEDHFILDWSYAGSYTSRRAGQPLRSYTNIQYSIETAGNLLYGISHLFKLPQDEDGAYKIFNIRYAQYAKADFQWSYNQIFNKQHRLVWHAGLGVAVPFANATSIPFEKRYYAGGANSVRGWTIRSLGPGGYRGNGSRIDYNNQAGDIKLDLNMEYRVKIIDLLEIAAFTDAGNIWTIWDYSSQPHGQFTKDFYKEIAWSYGVGLRLDLSFFVFRVDLGIKLYDPSYLYTDTPEKVWRTAPNGLGWKNDMTLHFAIGYPF